MSKKVPLLKIKNLKKQFDTLPVLKGLSLEIHEGEFVVIIGPSGAGKSTFLRCINQIIIPDCGEIRVNNENIIGLKRKDLRKIQSNIGMIFQHHNLSIKTNVFKNVLQGRLGRHSFIRTFLGAYPEVEKQEALDILKKVGLESVLYKKAGALSGGQMQRVGVCRAIMQSSKLLLADEPIASLDPTTAKIVMEELYSLATERGITCIVNLHQIHFAKNYATRVIGIKKGEIVFDGAPELLTDNIIHEIYEGNIDEVEYAPEEKKVGVWNYAT